MEKVERAGRNCTDRNKNCECAQFCINDKLKKESGYDIIIYRAGPFALVSGICKKN